VCPQNSEGETPLFLAVESGAVDVVDMCLVKSPACIKIKTFAGTNRAHAAAKSGNVEIFRKIVGVNRDLAFETDLYGNDLMVIAAFSGRRTMIKPFWTWASP
jgi:ankyrin repeat protein